MKVIGVLIDNYLLRINISNNAVMIGKNHNAGIPSGLAFHTGADERSLSFKKRYGLSLHIGSHKSAIGIVVFKERNHGSSDRDNLLGRNVHVFYHISGNFGSLFLDACGDPFIDKPIVFIEWFVSLSNNKSFFLIGSHIFDIIGDAFINNLAIRSFNKAERVDASIIGKRADKPNIGSFGSFYGAHAAVMRNMNIPDFKPCPFPAQPARSQCREPPLVCKFGKRIMLIHKLRKLRGAEKFLNGSHDRPNVNKILWRNNFGVVGSHAFFDDTFHTAHADTKLILKKFAHRTHAPVAQVVNVVRHSRITHESKKIINGRNNIGNTNGAVESNGKRGRTKHGIVAAIGFDSDFDRVSIPSAQFTGGGFEYFFLAFLWNFIKSGFGDNFIGGK